MNWRDIFPSEAPDQWAGLEVTIDSPRRPGLRIEAATGRRLRVMAEKPLLWARVHPQWAGLWWLRADGSSPLIIPPLGATEARMIKAAPGTVAWRSAWAKRLLMHLDGAPLSPLHTGTWRIEPCYWPGKREAVAEGLRPVPLYDADAATEVDEAGYEDWGINGSHGVLPLRQPSPPDAARIKALRKLARNGELPPLLLLFVSGFDMYLLLDGHDRLQAAQLEGCPPPALALSARRKVTYAPDPKAREALVRNVNSALARTSRPKRLTVKRLNDALIAGFMPNVFDYGRTQAYPVEGGSARWTQEVSARLAQLGLSDSPLLSQNPAKDSY